MVTSMSATNHTSEVFAQTTEPKVTFKYLDPVTGNTGIITQPITSGELYSEFIKWAIANGVPADWAHGSSEDGGSILYVSDWSLSATGQGDVVGDVEFQALDQKRFTIHSSEKTNGLGVIVISLPTDPKAIFTEIVMKATLEGYQPPNRIQQRQNDFYLDVEGNCLTALGWHVIIDSRLKEPFSVVNGWVNTDHLEVRNTTDIAEAVKKKMMQLEQANQDSSENNTVDHEVASGIEAQGNGTQENEIHAVPATLSAPCDGTGAADETSVMVFSNPSFNEAVAQEATYYRKSLLDVMEDSTPASEELPYEEVVEAEQTIPDPLVQTFDTTRANSSRRPAQDFGRHDRIDERAAQAEFARSENAREQHGGERKEKKNKQKREPKAPRDFMIDPNKAHQQRQRRQPNGLRIGQVQIDSDFLREIKDRMVHTIKTDGKDFINIGFNADTPLGRALDLTTKYHLMHPDFGTFASVGAFILYLCSGGNVETVRYASGTMCRTRRRELDLVFFQGWLKAAASAVWLRVTSDRGVIDQLVANTLPFVSQFVKPETGRLTPTKDAYWLVPVIEEISRTLKHGVANPDLEVVPDFDFLDELENRSNRQYRAA